MTNGSFDPLARIADFPVTYVFSAAYAHREK